MEMLVEDGKGKCVGLKIEDGKVIAVAVPWSLEL